MRLLADHGHWVVELASAQRPTRRYGAMSTPLDAWKPEDWAMGGFQSAVLSASTVRSRADATEPTCDRPFPQVRRFR